MNKCHERSKGSRIENIKNTGRIREDTFFHLYKQQSEHPRPKYLYFLQHLQISVKLDKRKTLTLW